MKSEYIITNEELAEKGLDLNEYALDGAYIPAIINRGLDISVSRCCFLNDNFKGEKSVEEALDKDNDLVSTFKKLQYNIVYNLIFTATDDPVDLYIDTIICHELGWGKINGIQKGLWYKNY
jgi:hypothetical protein